MTWGNRAEQTHREEDGISIKGSRSHCAVCLSDPAEWHSAHLLPYPRREPRRRCPPSPPGYRIPLKVLKGEILTKGRRPGGLPARHAAIKEAVIPVLEEHTRDGTRRSALSCWPVTISQQLLPHELQEEAHGPAIVYFFTITKS